ADVENIAVAIDHHVDARGIGHLREGLREFPSIPQDGIVRVHCRVIFLRGEPPKCFEPWPLRQAQSDKGFLLGTWRLPLRRWQREAFEAWSAHRSRAALIVATPGAGKTRFATRLAHALLTQRE